MLRIKQWLVGCLSLLLLLSPFGSFAEGADSGASGSAPADSGSAYVRIKEQWKGTYLYEADGQVRYGFTAPNDPSSMWKVEDAGNGQVRIANRATGRYLDIASVVPDDKITAPLATSPLDAAATGELWVVGAAPGQPSGYAGIASADYPTRLLNVQTQDGFAHANNWAQPGWGSSSWLFEPASDLAPVRIADQWKGDYLYEDGGQVKSGRPAMNDLSSQWYAVDAGGGLTQFRNRATGHYLVAANAVASGDPLSAAESTYGGGGPALWVVTPSADQPGYVGIAGADDPARLLNVQAQDGYAHANDWAQPGWGSALWKLEPASDSLPVRLKDQWKGQYLYEKDGTVQYGDPAASDKSSQWLVESAGAGVTLRNLATGRYAAAGGSDPLATTDSRAGAVWRMAPAKDDGGNAVDGAFTFAVPDDASAVLNVQAQDGSAHANDWAQPTWGSAQWKLADPSAAEEPQEPASPYIRIRNNWLQLYLYEDGGIVKYGNAAAGDPAAEWLLADANGKKRIQNRATGHYLTLDGVNGSRSAVRAADLPDGSTSGDWTIEDYQGFKIIHLASDTSADAGNQAYLNVENKLKALQYGVVPRDWGSPKWEFLPVKDSAPAYVRIKNDYRGTYLFEQDGNVLDGRPDAADPASQWQLSPGDKGTLIVNRATGHLISNENVASYADPLESLEAEPGWWSAQWTIEAVPGSEAKVLRSVRKPDVVVHDEDNKGFAQASELDPAWGSAHWLLEAAPELPPELPQGYVRIQNRGNGQYLYENAHHVALYGTPAANDASSHWSVVRSGDGTERIVNRATGNALSIEHGRSYLETSPADYAGDKNRWAVETAPAGGYLLLRSEASGHEDEYVHLEDGLGFAQYDLRSVESKGAQWTFEKAPDEAIAPSGDDGDANGATPALPDSNFIRIAGETDGGLIAEKDGAIARVPGDANDLSAQWRMEYYNGRKRFKNRATGHYLAAPASGDGLVASASGAGLDAQWTVADVLGYKALASVSADGRLAVQPADGTAAKLAAADRRDEIAHWAFLPVAGNVGYGAGEAFASGGAAVTTTAGGGALASGFDAAGASLLWAVNADAARTYAASLAYRNDGGAPRQLSLYVNGLKQSTLTFGASGSGSLSVNLALRVGYNAVELRADGSDAGAGLAIGGLTLANAVRGESRGATMPYVSYEAEDMATTGVPIEPGRDYGTIAAESSGRSAVRLKRTGQYAEFTAARAANALNLRYALPDSADGRGIQATLSVYVNGEKRGSLRLSSEYSWVYGKYPYSNNPADGDAHRFYDEAHALLGDIPAGATVRLQRDAGDSADYYVLDVVELEQAPEAFAMPEGFRSVTEFGAAADDGQDDTQAFKAAIAAAAAQGFGLWVPEGTFELSDGPLELKNVTVRGAGMWHTQLRGEGFMGVGNSVRVYDLAVDVGVTGRRDELPEAAFDGAYGTGSAIQNVWIEHAKAGIWTTLSGDLSLNTDGLYVGGVRVRDTYADGIHLSTGTKRSLVEQSSVRNTGDDAIALWSDPRQGASPQPTAEQARTEGNTIRFNTVQLPTLADNIAVFGGTDNRITDNVLTDTMGFGAGIAVSTRFNPVPFGGTTRVERNTLMRTGGHEANWNQDFGAIWLFAGDKPIDADIFIRNNEALDSTFEGLYVSGANAINASGQHKVLLENLVIDGTGTWGINASNGVTGSVSYSNLLVRNAKVGRLFNAMGGAFRLIETAGSGDPGDEGSGSGDPGSGDPGAGDPGAGGDPGTGGPGTDQPGSGVPGSGGPNDGSPGTGTGVSSAADDKWLLDAIAGGSAAIVVPTDGSPAPGAAVFSFEALSQAAAKLPSATLSIVYRNVGLELPLGALDTWLKQASATDGAQLELTIAPADDEARSGMAAQAAAAGWNLTAGTAYRFGAALVKDGAKTVMAGFPAETSVSLALDQALDGRTATVLAYDPADGRFRYVPARFETKDGRTVVAIPRLPGLILTIATAERTFADIADHWAKSDIERMASKGIVNGQAPDRFAPSALMTRAEFAALLARALGLPAAGGGASAFRDVAPDAWYAADVGTAAEYGLVQGGSDGAFRPNERITREQIAVMIDRALRMSLPATAASVGADSPLSAYADADRVSGWAREAVASLLAAGILNGRSNDRIAPQGFATRAEATVLLERALLAMGWLNA